LPKVDDVAAAAWLTVFVGLLTAGGVEDGIGNRLLMALS
jgi:hypothetical protein